MESSGKWHRHAGTHTHQNGSCAGGHTDFYNTTIHRCPLSSETLLFSTFPVRHLKTKTRSHLQRERGDFPHKTTPEILRADRSNPKCWVTAAPSTSYTKFEQIRQKALTFRFLPSVLYALVVIDSVPSRGP